MTSDGAGPVAQPYAPFPSFAEWASSSLDTVTFDRFADLFEHAKQNAASDDLQRIIDTATRWAAVDTGAIEGLYTTDRGFTITVAKSAAALDTIHLTRGEDVERAIKDAVAGYDYVLDLATGARPVNEQTIKELHTVLCASQAEHRVWTEIGWQDQPLRTGQYKTQSNSPLNLTTGLTHSYAPADDTPAEMARLIDELRTPAFADAHPVVQASYIHYAFVCVHPFADGNGRVSRALASAYLYRSPGVPLVVFADQKNVYIDALEAADRGDRVPFSTFVGDRVIDTLNMVMDEIRAPAQDFGDVLSSLDADLTNGSGVPHVEADALASRTLAAFGQALAAATERVRGAGALVPQMVVGHTGDIGVPEGFRRVPGGGGGRPTLQVNSTQPFQLTFQRTYDVAVTLDPAAALGDFVIVDGDGATKLSVFFREVRPVITEAFTHRLDSLADRELSALASVVTDALRAEMGRRGYTS